MSLFTTGVRPAVDGYLLKKAEEKRDYGDYWSASQAGYCMRKVIFERLKVPHVKEDARKTRVFEVGHLFHEWIQGITKEAGLSIAQEVELQDEDLMIRGHFDDLILIKAPELKVRAETLDDLPRQALDPHKIKWEKDHLILYDYKTQNSRAFSYQKDQPMSYFHHMQLGTYMYMLRKGSRKEWTVLPTENLTEARTLVISKDDLRMAEKQLMWSDELEKEVLDWWTELNKWWADKKIPPCTCADQEGGFMARETYNPFYFNDSPCSLEWYEKCKKEGLIK